jgi:hypothetical protein
MNRLEHFNSIEERLNLFAFRLEVRGKVNVLDMHLHAESFYQHLFNLIFGWNLGSANASTQNAQGIDLVDPVGRLVVQVTATATKAKVEHSLARDLSQYSGYRFKFISIAKSAEHLRVKTFANPYGLTFAPKTDVHDIPSILTAVRSLPTDKLVAVSEYVAKELPHLPDAARVEANLTSLIKRMSQEDFRQMASKPEIIPYDVEAKIAHNRIDAAKSIIDEHKIHYPRLDRIYAEFDKQGVNRSQSVLGVIRFKYNSVAKEGSPDDRFFGVVASILKDVDAHPPRVSIPVEELQLCVEVLVVDAFIRCKIFANPGK